MAILPIADYLHHIMTPEKTEYSSLMVRQLRNSVFILSLVLSTGLAAAGQTKANSTEGAKQNRENLVKATQDYKSSLAALLTSYEENAKQLDAKAAQLKSLFDDGLISKRDYETAQASSAEAKAKIEATKTQIAQADLAIVDAQKIPDAVVIASEVNSASPNVAWTTGNARFDSLIRSNGAKFGVDPYLVYCVMEQESHFNSIAVSPVGAQGLMQLMPGTAARFGVSNAFDPSQNIAAGAKYLSQLLGMFGGRVDLALASYNAGEGAVLKFGKQVPPYKETQDYVKLISYKYIKGKAKKS